MAYSIELTQRQRDEREALADRQRDERRNLTRKHEAEKLAEKQAREAERQAQKLAEKQAREAERQAQKQARNIEKGAPAERARLAGIVAEKHADAPTVFQRMEAQCTTDGERVAFLREALGENPLL